MTRRHFFRFFVVGSFLSFLARKVKAEQPPLKKAMFWRKIDNA